MGDESAEPEKVDLASPDLAAAKRAAFDELFPGVLADGVLDAGRLGDLLDAPVTAPPEGRERFGLMWAGKQDAVRSLLTPSRGTLVPELDKSVDFDTAQNVFIEGDNLEVLKLLQKAYNDKVKVIYIDPPYNTGKDFIYNDDLRDGLRAYLSYTGQIDEYGNRVASEAEAQGRRHSRWLSMIYPRLILARNLLTQDGVIFISIDDNEVATLRMLCNEVFGEENFVDNYVWESNFRPDNSSAVERENSQHILCFARNRKNVTRLVGSQKKSEGLPSLTKNSMGVSTIRIEPEWLEIGVVDGVYGPGDQGSGYTLEDQVVVQGGRVQAPFRLSGRVIWSQRYLEDQVDAGTRLVIKGAGFVPYSRKSATAPLAPTSLIPRDDVGDVLAGNAELRALFGDVPFNHPKPTSLLKYLVNSVTFDDGTAVILDFFAGSGSTAHAVSLLNQADGGRRRVISVNLPESVPDDSVAAEMGFRVVSEITLERIKRAMRASADVANRNVRVYSLASSRFRGPLGDSLDLFDMSESTLVDADIDLDAIAAEVLLKEGVALDVPWERIAAGGADVVLAGGVAVVLTLDISDAAAEEVFALEPRVVVFLEDGFSGKDAVKANAFTNAKNLGITMKTV